MGSLFVFHTLEIGPYFVSTAQIKGKQVMDKKYGVPIFCPYPNSRGTENKWGPLYFLFNTLQKGVLKKNEGPFCFFPYPAEGGMKKK